MAKLTPEAQELRLRLCAHLRRLYAEHHFAQKQQMARKLAGMNPGHFSSLYNNKTEIGLDIAVAIHHAFGESLNTLCDDDPPERFYPPGTHPGLFLQGEQPVLMAAEPAAQYEQQTAAPSGAATPQQRQRRRKRT